MSSQPVPLLAEPAQPPRQPESVYFGKLAAVSPDGRPLVQIDGDRQPTVARLAIAESEFTAHGCIGARVILVLERADPPLPVIIGIVRDGVAPAPGPAPVDAAAARSRAVEVSGTTLQLEGKEEIVLRCGLGSITIRADGSVVIKGTRLLSKASETNKVRGGSVLIN